MSAAGTKSPAQKASPGELPACSALPALLCTQGVVGSSPIVSTRLTRSSTSGRGHRGSLEGGSIPYLSRIRNPLPSAGVCLVGESPILRVTNCRLGDSANADFGTANADRAWATARSRGAKRRYRRSEPASPKIPHDRSDCALAASSTASAPLTASGWTAAPHRNAHFVPRFLSRPFRANR